MLVEHAGEGKVVVMPLFVAITEDMKIVFEGETGGAGDEGGGPKRGVGQSQLIGLFAPCRVYPNRDRLADVAVGSRRG